MALLAPYLTPMVLYESSLGIDIYIRNLSTVVSYNDLIVAMRAVQVQVTRDFLPVWGSNCNLQQYDSHRAFGKWQCIIMDDPDISGVLGYHDVTSEGQPLGKVFAKKCMESGFDWSVVFSHEILEMLIDPYCELAAFNMATSTSGRLHAYEVCDPVQSDDYSGYTIGATKVSNFVYPGWFDDAYINKEVDFLGQLPGPLYLYSGGYIPVFDVGTGTGWKNIVAATKDPNADIPSQERLALRQTPKSERVISQPNGETIRQIEDTQRFQKAHVNTNIDLATISAIEKTRSRR